ncbi:hypothetical protein IE53DRAFT_234701 [Violaceomyces palustris]|uniref:Uncharacterized protein n=1 Tax=Violaceomyces palustris TaxID=1673888 RepID=A0ACD0P4H5_9BASI|nr:hypothetical protein IE53DRAFT_234701 [Violaceomyces palustris]
MSASSPLFQDWQAGQQAFPSSTSQGSVNSTDNATQRGDPKMPLPRPPQPQRTSSALSSRTSTSAASEGNYSFSFDQQSSSSNNNTPNKPSVGTIGGHRLSSRGPSPGLSESASSLARVNSLAASVNTFRSANSSSPSFIGSHDGPGLERRGSNRNLFQRQASNHSIHGALGSSGLAGFGNVGSPQIHTSHPSRDGSGETEYGTPKLFLDNQPTFAPGPILSRSASISSASRFPTRTSDAANAQGTAGVPSLYPLNTNVSGNELGPGPGRGLGGFSPRSVNDGFSAVSADASTNSQQAGSYPFPATSEALANEKQQQNGAESLPSGPSGIPLPQNPNPYQHSLHKGSAPGRSSPALPAQLAQNSGRGTPTLNLPAPVNANSLIGGLLSPAAATFGSVGASPMLSPLGSPSTSFGFGAQGFGSQGNRAVQTTTQTAAPTAAGPADSFDEQLRASPFVNDLLDRLIKVELGLKDFSRHVAGISRNITLLLERTKGMPPISLGGGQGQGSQQQAASHPAAPSQDEIRALNAQVAALSTSVSQLLTLQGAGGGGSLNGAKGSGFHVSAGPQPPQQPVSGLGLGTPQIGGTPQLGGIERASSPRVGLGLNQGGFAQQHGNGLAPGQGHQQSAQHIIGNTDGGNRMSPRPGGGSGQGGRGWGTAGGVTAGINVKEERRWSSANANLIRRDSQGTPNLGLGLGPGTPILEEYGRPGIDGLAPQATVGSSAIVTKWEHLNLSPELLRSILKYGLGPPNKIQQRALPFLLRGSDIIAQAPPTQERIASYVIPALQLVLNVARETVTGSNVGRGFGLGLGSSFPPANRGPIALIISTTVDQATQAQRMALGLGSSLGIRVHLAAAGSVDIQQEAQSLVQAWPHIVVGTPQKMSELFTYLTNNAAALGPAKGHQGGQTLPISTAEVYLVVLDEVDQMIARNLADHVSSLLRVLPPPTKLSGTAPLSPALSPGLPPTSGGVFSPFEPQIPAQNAPAKSEGGSLSASGNSNATDRQIALFSNTVPQDVLNFAQSIHLRESVRVLVRREGGGGGPGAVPTGLGGPSQGLGNSVNAIGGPGGTGLGLSGGGQAGQYGQVQPSNALGAHPVNSSINALNDPTIAALKGLRQYYLYVAVSSGGGLPSPNPGVSNHASEMKLDLITDLLEDIEFNQTVIYCSSNQTLEAIIYKLASKGVEAMGLSRDMNSFTRQQTLSRFRSPNSSFMNGTPHLGGAASGGRPRKALVVSDVAVNPKDVHQVPLIVFYDMPRSVEEYKEKIACAASGGIARPSVCVNVVTASGGPRGDIEMLRTLECHLGCKMAELPMDSKQLLNF